MTIMDSIKNALHIGEDKVEGAEAAVKNEAGEVVADAKGAEAKAGGIVDGLKDKAHDMLDKTDLDEKAKAAFDTAKDKVGGLLDKTDLDEKAEAALKGAKDKVTGMVDKAKDSIK